MTSTFLFLLTTVLGCLFIFSGHVKISPQFFPEQHAHIKNEFGKFNKVFPFHQQTGWRPYAKNYRLATGILELACGFCLLLGFLQSIANVVLLMVMTNAIITFQKLNYGIEYIGAFYFISFLLVLRLVLVSRANRRAVVASVDKNAEKKTE